MKVAFTFVAVLLLVGGSTSPCVARLWTDSTGRYTIEAKLVASNDRMAVLQREDGELGAFPLDKLSDKDREFVKSQQAEGGAQKPTGGLQTWTLRDGTKVVGRIVDYASRDISLQRRRGRIYVNDRAFENLPEFYQKLIPVVVAHDENLQRNDQQALQDWLMRRPGAQSTIHIEGVILETENGDEYTLPFFLFSDEEQQLLKPGWKEWLAVHGGDKFDEQSDGAFLLQSLAAARQRDAKVNREIAMMQLKMQAVQAGLTSLWEVTLHPAAGQWGRSQWVVVPGRDSRQATENALQRYPGYVAGPVRRLAGG